MNAQSKRILITGGAGFIGSRLAAHLARENDVTVFDNFHPQAHDGNEGNHARLSDVTVVRGDVADADALCEAVRVCDPHLVYHLAAETGTGQSFDLPARYTNVNVMGTTHLIEAARAHAPNLRRIVLAGSRSVYGEGACVDAEGRPTPAMARTALDMGQGDFAPKSAEGIALTPVKTNARCVVAPASIYASTKLMQEYLLQQAFWGTDVEIGLLRLQNVYGPGQSLNNPYTGVISIFARQIAEGRTLNIYEDGNITRDFVLVDDVVDAFVRMGAVATCPEDVIDIGSGEGATIMEVARHLMVLLGKDPDNMRITGDFRAGDIRFAVADITRAREALGWEPRFDIKEGLGRFVEWSVQATKHLPNLSADVPEMTN
ncbi:MAG: NAD-dependent epimerase/dehydratase family protein [Pikeienuella sp.]